MEKLETLTISRAGKEKEVQTKFGIKKKQVVQFKETGETWFDVWASGLRDGQQLTGTRESRDWEGKTYWNFRLPKKEDVQNQMNEKILNKLTQMNVLLSAIHQHIVPKKFAPVPSEGIDYPEEDLGEEDINSF